MSGRLLRLCCILLAVSTIVAGTSHAGVIFKFGGPDFSGEGTSAVPFGGSGADLQPGTIVVEITDFAFNVVQVDVDFLLSTNSAGQSIDKLFKLYLNVAPEAFDLQAVLPLPSLVSGFSYADVQVDGAGLFDMEISLDKNNFGPGVSTSFQLKNVNSSLVLSATSFLSRSTADPNVEPRKDFFAAIHLNTTGNGESGHYAGVNATVSGGGGGGLTPEPGSLVMWSILSLGLCCRNRRRR